MFQRLISWWLSLWKPKKKPKTKVIYPVLNRRTSAWGCLSLIDRDEVGVEPLKTYRDRTAGSELMIGSTYIFSPNRVKYPNLDKDIGIFLDEIVGGYSVSARIHATHQITVMYLPRFRIDISKAEILFLGEYDLYGRYSYGRFATLVLYKVAELLLYRHIKDIIWDMEIRIAIKQVLR
jgi:hypothetical protein